MSLAMADITINAGLSTLVQFTCNLAINWAVGRKRAGVITVSDSGTTASAPPKSSGTIPAGALASGDLLEWGVDIFGPAGPKASYSLNVVVEQGGVPIANITHSGSVAAGAVQTDHGLWTVK